MKKIIKISYQNRQGRFRDLQSVPKLLVANKFLFDAGFKIGDNAEICYGNKKIIIRKVTQTNEYNLQETDRLTVSGQKSSIRYSE